ncbi:site-specific integrase [Herminiimonas contaminans]|uniref:Site-specific integrase n=1 Tax=Herminiimonas contaminans TaxID=1111140 RepID=A0ABS0ET66_9BURK|nr:site-specific integrase [Herminiimonas contaminans]MBF8178043.1 site-specific integrase [Herminiimonas contaminans]
MAEEQKKDTPYAESTLFQNLEVINNLHYLDSQFGIDFHPFPNVGLTAKRLGLSRGRTGNLPAAAAIKLVADAAKWLYEYAPQVLKFYSELARIIEENSRSTETPLRLRLSSYVKELGERTSDPAEFPFKIDFLDFGHRSINGRHSLRNALLCAMSACFVIIATMNARRRDEILHPKYGLRSNDLQLVDETLGLYEVNFYVEKSYRKRVPFYVNKITVDAIQMLESFNSVLGILPRSDFDENHSGSSQRHLFSYKRMSLTRGFAPGTNYFKFLYRGHETDAALFFQLALGAGATQVVTPHMFRRFYALIFFYQYENPDLQALALQLGHLSLSSTLIYITDPSSRKDFELITNTIGSSDDERKLIWKEHVREVDEQIQETGTEKHIADVFAILSGGIYAGGYSKYIRRIQNRLAKIVSFDVNTMEGATAVVAALKQRGNFPKPMRHGQCMAGSVIEKRAAHCSDPLNGKLRRENATPLTCSTCIFHLTSPAYLTNLEADERELQKALQLQPRNSVKWLATENEIGNLRQALKFFKKRMFNSSG